MSDSFVDKIERAFAERGGHAYGENVSQLDHALQCAWLAAEDGADDNLIAAALLHDFGHIIDGCGDGAESPDRDARHEIVGARALRRWFGPGVVRPIALHVQAKRHLCAVAPGYQERLSPASTLSLRLQGGPLTPIQCRRFENSWFSPDAIRLRRWDDAGKVAERRVPCLKEYWPVLKRTSYC